MTGTIGAADAAAGLGSILRLQVDRAHTAVAAGFEIVAEALILIERGQAGALHRADVDESVVAAVIGRDKAIALVAVEELYGSDGHTLPPDAAAQIGAASCVPRGRERRKKGRKAPKTVDL